jgi:acyl transferase domain-containing protein
MLEVTYVAFNKAGYSIEQTKRSPLNVGVFTGCDHHDWAGVPKENNLGFGGAGGAAAILANRFSFNMNLRGASVQVDTACSSSLVATHTCKLHLYFQENHIMEAGLVSGIQVILDPFVFIGNCAAHMLSPSGRCFTFNGSANGFARSEAVGSICMKFGHYIASDHLAMLSASYTNQDGKSASLTAPSGPAQVVCLGGALNESRLHANEVELTECHGTGTSLGDPIEVGSVCKVFLQLWERSFLPILVRFYQIQQWPC